MGSSFSATVTRIVKHALITCEGELDMDSAERFRRIVDEALEGEPLGLHIDCSRVSFIDSIGLRALLHTDEVCRERATPLMITASEPVRRLLDTLGVTLGINAAS